MPQPFDPLSSAPPADRPWGINFGGGVNSTALILECHKRGLRPDWILFSDTGSERPETYAATQRLANWVREHNWTPISTTRWERRQPLPNGATFEPLEQLCLRTGYLPSVAYGYAGCSTKYKKQPAERWRAEHGFGTTVYAIGYDAGEHRRVSRPRCQDRDGVGEEPWYPLYVWGVTRERCIQIIAEAGLPPVPKSSCFFCPHMRQEEWEQLGREHPDLLQRSLEIERVARQAGNADTRGLARRAGGYLADLVKKLPMAPTEAADVVCDCYEAGDLPGP